MTAPGWGVVQDTAIWTHARPYLAARFLAGLRFWVLGQDFALLCKGVGGLGGGGRGGMTTTLLHRQPEHYLHESVLLGIYMPDPLT